MTPDETGRWDEWQRKYAESRRRADVQVRTVGVGMLVGTLLILAVAVWTR